MSKQSMKHQMMILAEIEMVETVCLRRITEYQAKYSP